MKPKNITFKGYSSPNYTPVPDELFDEQLPDLSGAELKVLLYIIRRTFGFKKESDNISLNQLVHGITAKNGDILDRGTGLSLSTVQLALKGLIEKQCILAVRNQSKEKGDMPTTYCLNIRPATENQLGWLPKIGNGGYRKSVPQETVKQETDLQHRNSKAISNEENQGLASDIHTPAVEDHRDSLSLQYPRAGEKQRAHTGEPTSLADILVSYHPVQPHPVAAAAKKQPAPTPQILAAITEISENFADARNLRSNTSQAVNLWQASSKSEAAFVASLYEARSITRQQPHVRKAMPYFWHVVRDILGLQPEQHEQAQPSAERSDDHVAAAG